MGKGLINVHPWLHGDYPVVVGGKYKYIMPDRENIGYECMKLIEPIKSNRLPLTAFLSLVVRGISCYHNVVNVVTHPTVHNSNKTTPVLQ